MATCLISTFFENVGDELIYEGSRHLLDAFGFPTAPGTGVSKNNPLSIYSSYVRPSTHAPLHRATALRRAVSKDIAGTLMRLPFGEQRDALSKAELLCFAGTPLFYSVPPHSFLKVPEWSWPYTLFRDRIERHTSIPMIGLGVGSILDIPARQWLEQRRNSDEAAFIRRFIARAAAITTRDEPTQELLAGLAGNHYRKIFRSTCPSLWAPVQLGIARPGRRPAGRPRVSISFSTESAAWSASEAESTARRHATLHRVTRWLRDRGCELVFISHNTLDLAVNRPLANELNALHVMAATAGTLLETLAGMDLAISWRVHGALGAEALGVPAILFQTDSRGLLAADVGATVLDDTGGDDDGILRTVQAVLDAALAEGASRQARIAARRAREFDRLGVFLPDALSQMARV